MANDNNLRGWILVIGVLVILGVGVIALVSAVQQSARQAQQAIQPVSDLTSSVATQVSVFFHPTPTILPDPVTIIQGVRSLARLETIQYSVEKVITAETNQGPFGFLFGDRLILVAHGIVIAGIDLERLAPEHLELRGGVLYVELPEAEIFVTTLDNDKSYVYDRDTGLLTHGDIHLETDARQAAEAEIEKAAIDDGILKQASLNAENYLYRLLRDLGYPEVIFTQQPPED
jgi:hypothetical protein